MEKHEGQLFREKKNPIIENQLSVQSGNTEMGRGKANLVSVAVLCSDLGHLINKQYHYTIPSKMKKHTSMTFPHNDAHKVLTLVQKVSHTHKRDFLYDKNA